MLSSIPPEFGKLKSLKDLNARNNFITHIPSGTGTLIIWELFIKQCNNKLQYKQLSDILVNRGPLFPPQTEPRL